jgi:hypothetical protein
MDLHTNVYPHKPETKCHGQHLETPLRQRDGEAHGPGGEKCDGKDGILAGGKRSSCAAPAACSSDGARSGTRGDGTDSGWKGGRRRESCFVELDEEVRTFACGRGTGDKEGESTSGREFLFADVVRDVRVLSAARAALSRGPGNAWAPGAHGATRYADTAMDCDTGGRHITPDA